MPSDITMMMSKNPRHKKRVVATPSHGLQPAAGKIIAAFLAKQLPHGGILTSSASLDADIAEQCLAARRVGRRFFPRRLAYGREISGPGCPPAAPFGADHKPLDFRFFFAYAQDEPQRRRRYK
jgi:hypothetical protein